MRSFITCANCVLLLCPTPAFSSIGPPNPISLMLRALSLFFWCPFCFVYCPIIDSASYPSIYCSCTANLSICLGMLMRDLAKTEEEVIILFRALNTQRQTLVRGIIVIICKRLFENPLPQILCRESTSWLGTNQFKYYQPATKAQEDQVLQLQSLNLSIYSTDSIPLLKAVLIVKLPLEVVEFGTH